MFELYNSHAIQPVKTVYIFSIHSAEGSNTVNYLAIHHKRDAYVCQYPNSSTQMVFKKIFFFIETQKLNKDEKGKTTSIRCQHDIKRHNIS